MTTYTFQKASAEINWSEPTIWSGGVVPDAPDADVIIPTVLVNGSPYISLIDIPPGQTFSIRSLSLTNNWLAVAENGHLNVSGHVVVNTGGNLRGFFGHISAGSLDNNGFVAGPNEVSVAGMFSNQGTLSGAPTVTAGSMSNTGTLLAIGAGTLTVNVPSGGFTSLSGSTLTAGTYQAGGPFATTYLGQINLNVGGSIATNAAKIELNGGGMATFDAASGTFVPIESTMHAIAPSGTLTLAVRTFDWSDLTVAGTLILLPRPGAANPVFNAPSLIIDATGEVRGSGTIHAAITSNGLILSNALIIDGAVAGAGKFEIAAGGTLELNGATSQAVTFSGSGLLMLDNPASFAGSITPATGPGDQVSLAGVSLNSVTSYRYSDNGSGGVLTLHTSSGDIQLNFSGHFSTQSFTLSAGDQPLSPSLLITEHGFVTPPPPLTVSASHDYSVDPLSSIDSIVFANAAVATFTGSQFTMEMISPDVAITGNAGANGFFVNASGSFSMAGWGFSTWSADDTITVNGSSGADTITGSTQADTIFSGDGSDTLNGGDGNDTLVGHTLANLFGQEHDSLNGGDGNDTLYGEAVDTLNGGAGFDVLQVINAYDMHLDLAASGIEYVVSEFGNDVYTAATSTAAVEVYGSGGNDSITGGSGDDRLWGGVGNDTLVGNDGNDVLVGDLGADSLSGGAGNDRLYVDDTDTFIDGGSGFDAAYIATGTGTNLNLATMNLEWVADFAGGNDTIDGSGTSANLEVYAAGGADTVIGGSGSDFLWGGAGDDVLAGNSGNDTLVGETGSDRLTGGPGIDALFGNTGNGGDGAVDTFVFTDNWDTDYVFDFEHGTDKLDMTNVAGVHSIADLTITNVGGHAHIAFGANLISVANMAGQITAGDFLFS